MASAVTIFTLGYTGFDSSLFFIESIAGLAEA